MRWFRSFNALFFGVRRWIELLGNEPLKVSVNVNSVGYSGEEIAKYLSDNKVVCEFYDRDNLVLMLTEEIGKD
ncbi:MAG: hypothetical protein IKA72_05140, partial [Clostridia bacterium]|nr:hypothetical protein [Clostridia bacterium]